MILLRRVCSHEKTPQTCCLVSHHAGIWVSPPRPQLLLSVGDITPFPCLSQAGVAGDSGLQLHVMDASLSADGSLSSVNVLWFEAWMLPQSPDVEGLIVSL